MVLRAFRCKVCGHEFEKFANWARCLKCKGKAERIFSVGAIIVKNPHPHREGRGRG